MYCSLTWMKASTMPFATWRSGSEKVVSGSRIEKTGKVYRLPKANFSRVEAREMTAPEFISEPVAGRVRTEASGKAEVTGAWVARMSHGSAPSYLTAAAMNL